MPSVGDLVADKYRLERELGAGGGGVVFAAEHVDLQNRVAIKFLEATFDATKRKRFVREARACVKLQSEHVARVLDVGDERSQPYIVMEFLEGTDLRVFTYASAVPVPLADACEYVIHACHGLAEAHARGIVHRDMKPANLFLTRDAHGLPIVKVLDFGISKVDPEQSRSIVNDPKLLGTPQYMAPEQIDSAPNVDHRADIWGLGVTLYEILARGRPFETPALMDLIAAIAASTPPRVDRIRKDLPAGIGDVVERCLSKKPSGRFQSCAELAKALAPFAHPRARIVVEKVALLPPPSSDEGIPVAKTQAAPPKPTTPTPLTSADRDDFDADDYATTHGQSKPPVALLMRDGLARARARGPAPPSPPSKPELPLSQDDTTTAMVRPVSLADVDAGDAGDAGDADDETVAQPRLTEKKPLLDESVPSEVEPFVETAPMPKPDPRPPAPSSASLPIVLAAATAVPHPLQQQSSPSRSAAVSTPSVAVIIGIAMALALAIIVAWRVARSQDETTTVLPSSPSSSASSSSPPPSSAASPASSLVVEPAISAPEPPIAPPLESSTASVKPHPGTRSSNPPRRPPPPPATTSPPRASSSTPRAPSLSDYPPTRE